MSVSSAVSTKQLGQALIAQYQSLLAKDLDVQRVRDAHAMILPALEEIAPSCVHEALTPGKSPVGLHLYAFGSAAVYGFYEPQTDVDFVVLRDDDLLHNERNDCTSQLAKALQADFLTKLAKSLRRRNVSWEVEEVKRARVPVVRVRTPTVPLDITAYRQNGVRNSALLRRYFTDQDPMHRWLAMSIKSWSKRVGMNSANPGGYLTSYGFHLLVAHYLLRRHKVQFVAPSSCNVAQISQIPTYTPLLAPPNPSELGELVLDFLEYYSSTSSSSSSSSTAAAEKGSFFDWDTSVLSMKLDASHAVPSKESFGWTKGAEDAKQISQEKVSYRLCIEDPYEINLNVGRNVTQLKLDFLKKHFAQGKKTGLGLL